MARIFFLALTFYLVYRLVFELILPVFKTAKQVKRQFNDMAERNGHSSRRQDNPGASHSPAPKARVGEYIDFEEVK